MNIDRIKKTPLGRAWLSAFVRRVWGEALRSPTRAFLLGHAHPGMTYIAPGSNKRERDAEDSLWKIGLREGRHLTPLGVEVYLHGRKQAGKRTEPTGNPGGFACSGPMGGPGSGPMRRVGR